MTVWVASTVWAVISSEQPVKSRANAIVTWTGAFRSVPPRHQGIGKPTGAIALQNGPRCLPTP